MKKKNMNIKKFDQFVNESVENNINSLCNNKDINDAYSKLIEISKKSFNEYIAKLTAQLRLIDQTIEMIMDKYGNHIVGEPEVYIDKIDNGYSRNGMDNIELSFNTNIPSTEYEDYMDDIDETLRKEIENAFDEFCRNDMFSGRFNNIFIESLSFIEYNRETLELVIQIGGILSSGLINLYLSNVDSYRDKKDLDKYIFGK
jgi:hypothetical protein